MAQTSTSKGTDTVEGKLTASSMVARHPCIEERPYRSLSFSPSSEAFSVLGELRYIPIFNLELEKNHESPKGHPLTEKSFVGRVHIISKGKGE